jgi:hypothetical protein
MILAALLLLGCSSSSQEPVAPVGPSVSAPRATDTIPTTVHKQVKQARARFDKASASKTSSEVVTEKLTGYKTPCEYLQVRSRHYPKAVVAVSLPRDYHQRRGTKYPLVIAFGGASECVRPPRSGALAWIDYYKSDEAVVALETNQLESRHFRGLATPGEIKDFNDKLKRRPYGGIILVCPSSPPLTISSGPELPEYEAFIIEELVPALKQHYRVADRAIGVDGVSMGGSRSMYYGLKYPEVFESFGSVQGALGPYMDVYRDLVEENRDILRERAIQLVTSDRDVMAPYVTKMQGLLKENGIPCDFLKLTGPHDYIFNQGPGALALLAFHDRVLRASSPGPVK